MPFPPPLLMVYPSKEDRATIESKLKREGRRFGETVADECLPEENALVAMVWFPSHDEILVCVANVGERGGVRKRRLRFRLVERIAAGPTFAAVVDLVGESSIISGPTGTGGRLDTAKWERLTKMVESEYAATWRAVLHAYQSRLVSLIGEGDAFWERWSFERDAVGLALDMAGARRASVLADATSAGTVNPKTSFLRGTTGGRLKGRIEDRLIDWDAANFPWIRWREMANAPGHAVFELPSGGTLEILNVNRESFETAVGVDLVYINREHHAFVGVQYKRAYRTDSRKLELRGLMDSKFQAQLEKQSAFADKLRAGYGGSGPASWRLGEHSLFYKFCDPADVDLALGELVLGAYVPTPFVSALAESAKARGTGTLTMDSDSVRYLNNSMFSSLVATGWVGSCSLNVPILQELMGESNAEGRETLLAIHHPE